MVRIQRILRSLITIPAFAGFFLRVIHGHSMQVIHTIGCFNRTRGLITWRMILGDDGQYFALRHDGRKFPYASINDMEEGYKKLTQQMRFAPVCLLTM